jgi:hypothetical protein
MVDRDEAPAGYYAMPSQNCVLWSGQYELARCAFWTAHNCINTHSVGCQPAYRKDHESVIFIAGPNKVAPLKEIQQADIIDDFGLNSSVDSTYAPAGMIAKPATDGCQGCFYLKGRADCVRSSPISCTSLGRKDEFNVIFVPR